MFIVEKSYWNKDKYFKQSSKDLFSLCDYVPLEASKRVLETLELELQMVLSHHVGAEDWTWGPPEKQLLLLTTEPSLVLAPPPKKII